MALAASSSPPSPWSCGKLASWTIFAVLLQFLGLSLFVIGFFPVKPTLPGFSGLESYQMPICDTDSNLQQTDLQTDELRSLFQEHAKLPPLYDRLILMVIDGLPAEFVLGRDGKPPDKAMAEAMPYTQSLLSNGKAKAYHAKAAPPTVTMPRLKAMVSGAIGGFLDVAFNFNTQALLDDNLLDQFKRIGWKMVMLGDETWIKLFPTLFTRKDGVSSFYVKDTIEVDYNVSRHLEFELTANDWSLLIFHYLGLDHVGHIGGRQSMLMAPKLKEMDEVIKTIHMHSNLQQHDVDSRTLLVVVSDHGMTSSGNHGGSSYEETDSLALFVSLGAGSFDDSRNAYLDAFQVDIAPTLALLFGVPIPKNNIGVLMMNMFDALPDEQKLRALELNSWQLLRLLQAHLPGSFSRGLSFCSNMYELQANQSIGCNKEKLCSLFIKAKVAHNLWQLHWDSGSKTNNLNDLKLAIESYNIFLRNTSEWLSRRATDRPSNFLFSGITIILVSCVLLINILFCLLKQVHATQKKCWSQHKALKYSWHAEEAFIIVGILMHVMSLGASSMVEEEQYTWHFLASTLYLIFLFNTTKAFLERQGSHLKAMKKEEENLPQTSINGEGTYAPKAPVTFSCIQSRYQILLVLIVLICGRILRGWHQGGVNWVHLPDISKLLVKAGPFTVKAFQICSLLVLLFLSWFSISMVKSRNFIIYLLRMSHFLCGLLVLLHIILTQNHEAMPLDPSTNLIPQIFYITAGSTVFLTVLASPLVLPLHYDKGFISTTPAGSSLLHGMECNNSILRSQDPTYLIGITYMIFWCLLQLLLQQPINSVPIVLIFLQIVASIIFFSTSVSNRRYWVEVSALYFLGMTGHFGLGNSNSLATVDVAGAFIGISKHSTILSGILMFIITYAAHILSFLGMLTYISLKDVRCLIQQNSDWTSVLKSMIGFPCLVPLVFNSIVLPAFTIILWLMRSHLFVWSVFSPKYLYVCAATVCVYIGVSLIAMTGSYTCFVLSLRTKKSNTKIH